MDTHKSMCLYYSKNMQKSQCWGVTKRVKVANLRAYTDYSRFGWVVYNKIMRLHRASKKPDWHKVEHKNRNIFQKVAEASGGFVTPANMVTVVGLGLVIYGNVMIFRTEYITGLVFLAAGRLLDVADGLVAELTSTKSLIGEAFDAISDKVGTLLTVTTLVLAGITLWWLILVLALPQITAILAAVYSRRLGKVVHPTWQGKISMATLWLAVVSMVFYEIFSSMSWLAPLTYLSIIVSLALGFYASWQYATGRS